jgi:predicted acyltransferase
MKRQESIDAFRGFTILGMILVNSPGSWDHVYKPLLHAEWNGCTLADLVFPFFLFIVGVTIIFAFSKYLQRGVKKIQLLRKAFVRTIILFGIGIVLNIIMSNFKELRIPGVLQRIAIVYFICSVLFLYAGKKFIIIFSFIVLIGYWMLLLWVPPPGQITELRGPGLNIVNWVDSRLIPGKLYRGNWDPEGLLSTFPAVVTGITGMFAGWILRGDNDLRKKTFLLVVSGISGILAGLLWNQAFPLNKNLWTSSYVLFTSGLAFLLLAIFNILLRISGFRRWMMPFIMPGSNSLGIYILHLLLFYPLCIFSIRGIPDVKTMFMNLTLISGLPLKLMSLIWATLYTLICFIPSWILYRKKIFLKV